MRTRFGLLLSILAILGVRASLPAAEPEPSVDALRAAVDRALPLLQKGAAGHISQRSCYACHNQGLPVLAMTTARARGFAIKDEDLRKQTEFTATFLEKNRANYLKGRGQGGQVATAGYALWLLELGGWKPNATTAAVAEYLLLYNENLDHWRMTSNRPPSETSSFTACYVALRGLKTFGTPEQKDRIAARVATVRGWLQKTPARDTEDHVFRLWSLQMADAPKEGVQTAARQLAQLQRGDGGWAQLDSMDSDAYATGSALVALHEAGDMPATDPVYQRGLRYLLRTQQVDGSWLVRSRSKPFQTYYESGFPHGKDQFISIAASGWATTALALACPRK
jgi:hypothetical protein